MKKIYFKGYDKYAIIPVGWRAREDGERLTKGDKYLQYAGWKWTEVSNGHINQSYEVNDDYRCITKDKEKKKINYTKQQKENFILKLKNTKAIYADCGIEINDENEYDLAAAMVEEKLIKEYDDKFYVEA